MPMNASKMENGALLEVVAGQGASAVVQASLMGKGNLSRLAAGQVVPGFCCGCCACSAAKAHSPQCWKSQKPETVLGLAVPRNHLEPGGAETGPKHNCLGDEACFQVLGTGRLPVSLGSVEARPDAPLDVFVACLVPALTGRGATRAAI